MPKEPDLNLLPNLPDATAIAAAIRHLYKREPKGLKEIREFQTLWNQSKSSSSSTQAQSSLM